MNKTEKLIIELATYIGNFDGYDGKGVAQRYSGHASDILKICKESGLMFTQTTRYPQDVPLPENMIIKGIKWWEFKEIIEDIEI